MATTDRRQAMVLRVRIVAWALTAELVWPSRTAAPRALQRMRADGAASTETAGRRHRIPVQPLRPVTTPRRASAVRRRATVLTRRNPRRHAVRASLRRDPSRRLPLRGKASLLRTVKASQRPDRSPAEVVAVRVPSPVAADIREARAGAATRVAVAAADAIGKLAQQKGQRRRSNSSPRNWWRPLSTAT
jgi:hypothetical protein